MTGPGPAKKPARTSRAKPADLTASSMPTTPPAPDDPVTEAVAQPEVVAVQPEVVAVQPEVVAVLADVPGPATAPDPAPAVAAAPVLTTTPSAAPEPVPTPTPIAAAPAAGTPPPSAPRPAGPDVAAAVDKAIGRLRQRLTVGEILVAAGALLIGLAFVLFVVVFGDPRGTPSELAILLSGVALLALWLHNTTRHDFGTGYRTLLAGIGLLLGFLVVVDALATIRLAIGGSSYGLGEQLLWWAGGVVAAVGGWLVWSEPH